tara:strand:+ start:784 stop:996 length:213 start_codon:yes stop_codon:yes gene_type:complete
MSFRIIDSKTGEVIIDTMDITHLMDRLDYFEHVEERPAKEVVPRISDLGEEMKITGERPSTFLKGKKEYE